MKSGLYLELTVEQVREIIKVDLKEILREYEETIPIDLEHYESLVKDVQAIEAVLEMYQSPEERVREYVEDSVEGKFQVVFTDCNGDNVSATLTGEQASDCITVMETFIEAYKKSGFVNELTLTIHNPYMGDTTLNTGKLV